MKTNTLYGRLYILTSALLMFCISNINSQDFVKGEIIVRIKNEKSVEQTLKNEKSIGFIPKKQLSKRLNIWLVEFPKSVVVDTAINVLKRSPDIIYASPNRIVKQRITIPNDGDYSQQWALPKIKCPEAWDFATGGNTVLGDEIVIAIIDGGFDLAHTDINFWNNNNEIPNNNIDDDNNGYIDDFNGWNAYDGNGVITTDDHGTHVSGIAGAIGNNNNGISGVIWNVQVLPIMGSSEDEATVIEAYSYALEMRTIYNETNGQKGAFIVATNSSFGIDKADASDYPLWCTMYDELGQVGILSVASTANGSWDVDNKGDMPTGCTSEFLIGITNTDNNDELNSDAAWGKTSIDLASPGTGIYSTLPNNSFGSMDGTSMAAPHVTGAIALMYSAACEEMMLDYRNNPAQVALSIKQFLFTGSDPVYNLLLKIGYGRLNVYRSILRMFEQYDFDIYVTGTETTSKQYEAIHDIIVENYTGIGSYDVTFRSGNSITFKPGTHIKPDPGKIIKAYIDNASFDCAIPFEPLTIDLLAPEDAWCGGGHNPITCNAIVTGGKPPYSYIWSTKLASSGSWVTYSVNNPNFVMFSSEGFYIQVQVTDDRSITALSPIKYTNCYDNKADTLFEEAPEISMGKIANHTTVDGNSIDDQTSIEINNLRHSFNVYPNPTTGQVTITFTLAKSSIVTIQITDYTGKKVADVVTNKQFELGKNNIEYNTGDLPAGLYFYKISTNEGLNALKLVLTE